MTSYMTSRDLDVMLTCYEDFFISVKEECLFYEEN
jgi:hypothetical protein